VDAPSPGPRSGRQSFLRGMVVTAASYALAPLVSTRAAAAGLTTDDRLILHAAQIAEALAVTTYTSIITAAPFYTRLFPQDQAYLQAARNQEMAHYTVVRSLTSAPPPYTSFFYPAGMFAHAPSTLSTLISLEEAFIAAYLLGVQSFSRRDLRVTAARIMGVESDHRTMARVLAPGLDPLDGGPLRTVRGIQNVAEAVDPANNNGFERTLDWTGIDQAMAALLPFVDAQTAHAAHFDVTKRYIFQPFTPVLSSSLGAL
jgi:hypothetical protein